MPFPVVEAINENTLIITFANKPSETLSVKISRCWSALNQEFQTQLINAIPASTTLMLEFLEQHPPPKNIETFLARHSEDDINNNEQTHHFIPVYYHPAVAPDLENILRTCEIKLEQLVRLHSEKLYHVFAVGFLPGFAYLGELDKRIALPRIATPRTKVAAGSVGIAENITGIYPRSSPGGWNIIGRCPLNLSPDFLSSSPDKHARMFKVGDKVSFSPIDKQSFESLLTWQ